MDIRFEGFDRRIDKINAFLNSIGVKDLAEAKKICEAYKAEYQKLEDEKNKEITRLIKNIEELQETLNIEDHFL